MESNVQLKRARIVRIKVEENEDVYDITTTNNHNFFANGVVVHNCGEQTLAPGGVCNLSSINLTQFVNNDRDGFNLENVKKYVRYLVRFLDNVNTYSDAPLPEYVDSLRHKRRIGIGVMGWGSALFMMKIRFASEQAGAIREELMSTIARTAYEASIDLAVERGAFKYCDPEKHANGKFVKSLNLSLDYMHKLRTTGIRNSSLLSIQPTGNCQTIDGIIKIDGKDVSIAELLSTVENLTIEDLKEGDIVKIDEIEIDNFEGKDSINKIYVNGPAETLKIVCDDIVLKSTHNHKYLVKIDEDTADWITAAQIKPGMKIIAGVSD